MNQQKLQSVPQSSLQVKVIRSSNVSDDNKQPTPKRDQLNNSKLKLKPSQIKFITQKTPGVAKDRLFAKDIDKQKIEVIARSEKNSRQELSKDVNLQGLNRKAYEDQRDQISNAYLSLSQANKKTKTRNPSEDFSLKNYHSRRMEEIKKLSESEIISKNRNSILPRRQSARPKGVMQIKPKPSKVGFGTEFKSQSSVKVQKNELQSNQKKDQKEKQKTEKGNKIQTDESGRQTSKESENTLQHDYVQDFSDGEENITSPGRDLRSLPSARKEVDKKEIVENGSQQLTENENASLELNSSSEINNKPGQSRQNIRRMFGNIEDHRIKGVSSKRRAMDAPKKKAWGIPPISTEFLNKGTKAKEDPDSLYYKKLSPSLEQQTLSYHSRPVSAIRDYQVQSSKKKNKLTNKHALKPQENKKETQTKKVSIIQIKELTKMKTHQEFIKIEDNISDQIFPKDEKTLLLEFEEQRQISSEHNVSSDEHEIHIDGADKIQSTVNQSYIAQRKQQVGSMVNMASSQVINKNHLINLNEPDSRSQVAKEDFNLAKTQTFTNLKHILNPSKASKANPRNLVLDHQYISQKATSIQSIHQASIEKKTITYINDQNQVIQEDDYKDITEIDKSEATSHVNFSGMKSQLAMAQGPVSITAAFELRKNSIQRGHHSNKGSFLQQSKKTYKMSENSNQKEIIISKKDIKFVTVNMLNLQLLHIDVSNNKIIYLPDEICLLSKLVTLKVEHNNLKFLPDDIGNLKHLKVLSAKSNDLRRLPVSLQHCKSLEELLINDNSLVYIHPNVGSNSELKTLLIQGNKISFIPKSLAKCSNLVSMSLEWFQYLDPPQQLQQSGEGGKYVIQAIRDFCGSSLQLLEPRKAQDQKHSELLKLQFSFASFLCHLYICKPLNSSLLSDDQIIEGINTQRFHPKKRCIIQTLCSNKHPHLLEELVKTTYEDPISTIINQNIDLNVVDSHDQAPTMCALRQETSLYAKLLLSNVSNIPLRLNQLSLKHGYPLHIAILANKFDIVLDMLNRDDVDPKVMNTIGANCVHLLFVKYDKDSILAYEILKKLIAKGVNVNLVDQIGGSPVHIALRKNQYQAISDCISLNKQSATRCLFDLKIKDKRGQTPLHYVVEKGDYQMFLVLMSDPNVDVNILDDAEMQKARKFSVIFSAFHKILFSREKFKMRKKFIQEKEKEIRKSPMLNLNSKSTLIESHAIHAPISVKNKMKSKMNFNLRTDSHATLFAEVKKKVSLSPKNNREQESKQEFVSINESIRTQMNKDENSFVQSHVFNFRQMKKRQGEKKDQVISINQDARGRKIEGSQKDSRAFSTMSKNSNIMQVNQNSHYFKSEYVHHQKRQNSVINAFHSNRNQIKHEDFGGQRSMNNPNVYMSVGHDRRMMPIPASSNSIRPYLQPQSKFLNQQRILSGNASLKGDDEEKQNSPLSSNSSFEDFNGNQKEFHQINSLITTKTQKQMQNFKTNEFESQRQSSSKINFAHCSSPPETINGLARSISQTGQPSISRKKPIHQRVNSKYEPLQSENLREEIRQNYFSHSGKKKNRIGAASKSFGPKPLASDQNSRLFGRKNLESDNSYTKLIQTTNLDEIQLEVPSMNEAQNSGVPGSRQKSYQKDQQPPPRRQPEDPQPNSSQRARTEFQQMPEPTRDSTKIFISNLNINLNNVFINLKDVSIPNSPNQEDRQHPSGMAPQPRPQCRQTAAPSQNNSDQNVVLSAQDSIQIEKIVRENISKK